MYTGNIGLNKKSSTFLNNSWSIRSQRAFHIHSIANDKLTQSIVHNSDLWLGETVQ